VSSASMESIEDFRRWLSAFAEIIEMLRNVFREIWRGLLVLENRQWSVGATQRFVLHQERYLHVSACQKLSHKIRRALLFPHYTSFSWDLSRSCFW